MTLETLKTANEYMETGGIAMTREILFRGKEIRGGEWVYGFYVQQKCNDGKPVDWHQIFILDDEGYSFGYRVCPSTVGQFTGLLDKDGGRIFEGDVVEVTNGIDAEAYRGKIVFEYCEWNILHNDSDFESLWNQLVHCEKCVEVIGNVHDDGRLLEGENEEIEEAFELVEKIRMGDGR